MTAPDPSRPEAAPPDAAALTPVGSLAPKRDATRGILQSPVRAPPIELSRFEAPADLAPYVEHFWSVHWDVRRHGPITRETLPHPSLHWVTEARNSELQGIVRGRFSRVLRGEGRVVGVKFLPGGLCAFVSEPMDRYTGRRWPAVKVLGRAARGLPQALAPLATSEAVEHLCALLRALEPKPDAQALRAGEIVRAISQDHTITRVAQVCDAYHLAPLALQRLFRRKIGVSPKWVVQRYRLHEALERIHAQGPLEPQPWASLAADLGFTDQAHFGRTFKSFVGVTPGQYLRRLRLQPHR